MSPEVMANLDAIKVNMNEAGMNAINIVLAFVMFGVALGIKPKTFIDVVKKPQSVALGIICQLLLLPALTFLLTITFDGWISPMIALGMILVASCPGGNISNFLSALSKGNIALSVSSIIFILLYISDLFRSRMVSRPSSSRDVSSVRVITTL